MGDTVCGFMPNSYETAVALFASAAIGATWCSASVDFGHAGVLDRFRQVYISFITIKRQAINTSSTDKKSVKLSLYEFAQLKSLISSTLLLNPYSIPYR